VLVCAASCPQEVGAVRNQYISLIDAFSHQVASPIGEAKPCVSTIHYKGVSVLWLATV
jgi:hypothetical protein